MIIRNGVLASVLAALLSSLPQPAFAADTGLITKPSKYSVPETIERFKAAIKARGWIVFTDLDHAAAAYHDDEFKTAVKRIRERKDRERREKQEGRTMAGAPDEGH